MKRRKTKTGKRRAQFSIKAKPGAKVCVAGNFNGWDPDKNQLKDRSGRGEFRASLLLEPGEYEYKFIIDGDWHIDPENPHWVTNEFGTLNNVLRL